MSTTDPTPYSVLRVEMEPMNPPKPVGIGVFKDGKLLAHLTIDELRRAVSEYEEMLATYKAR
jgi:hypothetical protein